MEIITSRSNQQLKYAKKVGAGRVDGRFIAEGVRLVAELLVSPIKVEHLLLAPETDHANPEVRQRASDRGIAITPVKLSLFNSFSTTKSPQGVAAVGFTPTPDPGEVFDHLSGTETPVVLLHKVANPGNLGSVVRVAEAAGTPLVVTTAASVNPFNPRALRGSMGSVFRLPVVHGLDLRDALSMARRAGLLAVGTSSETKQSIYEYDWERPSMLVVGPEATGLAAEETALLDEMVRIPMAKEVESLNLAVATGIVLYESVRPRLR